MATEPPGPSPRSNSSMASFTPHPRVRSEPRFKSWEAIHVVCPCPRPFLPWPMASKANKMGFLGRVLDADDSE